MVEMQRKVTYRFGVYSKLLKVQEGKMWNTQFITLTRQEVQDFHTQRARGDFVRVWDTVADLMQKDSCNSLTVIEG
jgi:hypothetical protein